MTYPYPRATTVLATWEGLKNTHTGKYDDAATVTVLIAARNSDGSVGSTVSGSSVTLTAATWGGNYHGSIPSTVSLTIDTRYLLVFTATSGSDVRTRPVEITASDDESISDMIVVGDVPASYDLKPIVRGGSYLAADDTALWFKRGETELDWPDDLTGYTITCTLTYVSANVDSSAAVGTTTTLNVTGTILAATGPFQAVEIPITAAQTQLFYVGTSVYDFKVKAVSGTTVRPIAKGSISVIEGWTS